MKKLIAVLVMFVACSCSKDSINPKVSTPKSTIKQVTTEEPHEKPFKHHSDLDTSVLL